MAEALIVAEAVTGIDASILTRGPRIDLLDSALHAPRAGFGDVELYPNLIDKAAVLTVRIANNHPLLDGNKRLAWGCLNMFLTLNARELQVAVEEAVAVMLGIASGEIDEAAMAEWLDERIE